MKRCLLFSPAEDIAIWKIAIEQGEKKNIGSVLKKRMRSERTVSSLLHRFNGILLQRLSKTKFHPETKLMLCQQYKITVDDEFLNELENDADVQVDNLGVVTSFRMKDTCEKNKDMELSDEEFIKISTVNVVKNKKYTPTEDGLMWKYVIDNHEKFSRGSSKFWNSLSRSLNRSCVGMLHRFVSILLPELPTMNFLLEDKLKLYTCCHEPVDQKDLEAFKNYAELKIDKSGHITSYTLKNGRPEKRKNTKKTRGRPKKARRKESEQADVQKDGESTGNEEDELIFDGVVPGTGHPQPERIIIIPKIETIDDVQQLDDTLDSPEDVIPAFVKQPKAEVLEAVYYPHHEYNVGGQTVPANQCASMGMMTEMMQKMKEKMDSHEENMKTYVAEMKEELKEAMKTSAEQQSEELKRDLEATLDAMITERFKKLEADIETMIMRVMTKGLDEMKNISKSEDETAPSRKKCLLDLKKLISSFDSPETAAVEQKIDTAVQDLPDIDERPLPPGMLGSVIATANRFINRLL